MTAIATVLPITSYAKELPITIDNAFTIESDGLWEPGRIESKDFYINNHQENDITIDRFYITLKSSEYFKTGEKLDINSKKFKEFAKYSTVTLKHEDTVLFKEKFEDILADKEVEISKDIDIKGKDKELLNMTIDMDLEMGNNAQALNNVFEIGVAYTMEELPGNPEKPSDDNTIDKLPQTGGDSSRILLIAGGVIAIVLSIILIKKSNKKGVKRHG